MFTRSSLLLALACASCAPASTGGAYYGYSMALSSAPPPRVYFVDEPVLVMVPGTSVYVVENTPYDMFRYGSYWYLSTGPTWYRARTPSGPYVAVELRSVPKSVLTVPAKHWKRHPHGGPPGLKRSPGSRGRG